MSCAPSEDSDQPEHPPCLIRVFAVRSKVAKSPRFLHADSEDYDRGPPRGFGEQRNRGNFFQGNRGIKA